MRWLGGCLLEAVVVKPRVRRVKRFEEKRKNRRKKEKKKERKSKDGERKDHPQ